MKIIGQAFIVVLSLLCSVSFNAQDILISEGGVVNTCSGTLYDSGGAGGEYLNDELYTITICSDQPGLCLQAEFISFEIEGEPWDTFSIYEGADTNAPLYGTYGDLDPPQFINAGTECLTFVFVSDGSVTQDGFEIQFSCACPTCDDGVLNGEELGTDCGGPDCPACDFNAISDEGTLNSCDVQLFDSGIMTDYGANEDYTMTICSDGSLSCMLLDFVSMDIEFGDHLYIYDGPTTDGFLVADYTNTITPSSVTIPSDCVTLRFTSNEFTEGAGFEALISCTDLCPTCNDGILNGYEIGVDCGGPDCSDCPFIIMDGSMSINTCEATIYDNGYLGDYANASYDVLTVCSDNPGECIQAEFISFQIEGEPYDTFSIYAGEDTNAPLVGTWGDQNPPQFINAGTECLTFEFITDGSVVQDGYEIEISCVCPTCNDGIMNGQEIAVDCGGPDCPECSFNSISEGGIITSCEVQLFDSGINGDYQNDEENMITICGDNGDLSCTLIDFVSLDISGDDHLYVYDGTDVFGQLLADITDTDNLIEIIAPSNCVTLLFVSNGFQTADGFEALISCTDACPTCDDGIQNGYEIGIDCGGQDCPDCMFHSISEGGQVIGCDYQVFDSGLDEVYENNENYTITLCPEQDEECMQLQFVEMQIALGDHLYIYEGMDTNGTLIEDISGSVSAEDIQVMGGCATLQFTSNGTGQGAGFLIDVGCCLIDGVEEFENFEFNLHPNPAVGSIQFSSEFKEAIQLEFLDLKGSVLLKTSARAEEKIDISTLVNGIYLVNAYSEGVLIKSKKLSILR